MVEYREIREVEAYKEIENLLSLCVGARPSKLQFTSKKKIREFVNVLLGQNKARSETVSIPI